MAAKLRSGNVHSGDGWEDMLLPEGPQGAPRQQKQGKEVVFRADAAFASLERDIAELLTRPVGHPSELEDGAAGGEDDPAELPWVPFQ